MTAVAGQPTRSVVVAFNWHLLEEYALVFRLGGDLVDESCDVDKTSVSFEARQLLRQVGSKGGSSG